MNGRYLIPALLIATVLSGCRTATPPAVTPPPTAAVSSASRDTHEGLNTILWVQSSTEFRGAAIGTFVSAQRMLEKAIADPTWTAAVEQKGTFETLPPAVIVDVDETVLDNSPYQARLLLDHAVYKTDSWNAWVREEKATATPGALEFARFATDRGVTIFYITNRRSEVEEATRRNLVSAGFPVPATPDVIYTRGERPEWSGGDKTARRAEVARSHRVLLVIGDNLGDFLADERTPMADRLALAKTYREYWGTRWFMVPNPMYGTWESAIFGYRSPLTDEEQLRLRRDALRTDR